MIEYSPFTGGEGSFSYYICDSLYRCDSAEVAVVFPYCTITGTRDSDNLVGTPGDDVICGLDGDDTIYGGDGDDTIRGNAGADTVDPGIGNNTTVKVLG